MNRLAWAVCSAFINQDRALYLPTTRTEHQCECRTYSTGMQPLVKERACSSEAPGKPMGPDSVQTCGFAMLMRSCGAGPAGAPPRALALRRALPFTGAYRTTGAAAGAESMGYALPLLLAPCGALSWLVVCSFVLLKSWLLSRLSGGADAATSPGNAENESPPQALVSAAEIAAVHAIHCCECSLLEYCVLHSRNSGRGSLMDKGPEGVT